MLLRLQAGPGPKQTFRSLAMLTFWGTFPFLRMSVFSRFRVVGESPFPGTLEIRNVYLGFYELEIRLVYDRRFCSSYLLHLFNVVVSKGFDAEICF